MSATQAHTRTEQYLEWTLLYTTTPLGGESLSHAVDVLRDGVALARITSTINAMPIEVAIDKLRDRAHDWIADYDCRDHSGGTDFAELS